MEPIQHVNEIIDIANWRVDEEYWPYPEGKRIKGLHFSPEGYEVPFLRPNYPYLFKLSSHRYPEQFWMEIFAYELGKLLDVPVTKYFVAINSKENLQGALSEWFFTPEQEIYNPGGDYFLSYIPGFDRKKGRQHNFITMTEIFEDLSKEHPELTNVWLSYWAKVFVFDAFIGNTDRHQDNWGVITDRKNNKMRIAPVFDNGTSLGHEIHHDKLSLVNDNTWLERYLCKGYHHIRWDMNTIEQEGHFDLLEKFKRYYPQIIKDMEVCLAKVNFDEISCLLQKLCLFEILVKLSKERADFMLTLLQKRYTKIVQTIEK